MTRHTPRAAEKKTIAERAVRGVLGGWVAGKTSITWAGSNDHDDDVIGVVRVYVKRSAIDTMLRRENAKRRKK